MKHLIWLFLSAIMLSCYTPKYTVDDLKKYSYLLALLKDSNYNGRNIHVAAYGTGFFMRENDKLYLTSANHVFTGIDNDRHDATKMAIFPMGSNVSLMRAIDLDSIQKTHPLRPINKFPDALAYRINLPPGKDVYSIERFMKKKVRPLIGDSLFFWGYPSKTNGDIDFIRFAVLQKPPILYAGKMVSEDSISIVSSPDTFGGASGSPVFLKRKNKYYFTGILYGGIKGSNMALIAKFSAFKSEFGK